jgi:hypothetical protein
MERQVKLITSRGTSQTFTSSAEKLQDLFPKLAELGVNIEGSRFLKDADYELNGPQARLPEGDFKLYVSPKQTKSGYYDEDEDIDTNVNIYEELDDLKKRVTSLERQLSREGASIKVAAPRRFEDIEDENTMAEIERRG